jgi:hypothetical protein
MKLTMLKMSKKKIIGAVCAIALFAGGAVVGAQINASAANNAIAVLPIAKGGTGQNNLASVLGVGSANKLSSSKTFSLTGASRGNVTSDLSGDLSINTTSKTAIVDIQVTGNNGNSGVYFYVNNTSGFEIPANSKLYVYGNYMSNPDSGVGQSALTDVGAAFNTPSINDIIYRPNRSGTLMYSTTTKIVMPVSTAGTAWAIGKTPTGSYGPYGWAEVHLVGVMVLPS